MIYVISGTGRCGGHLLAGIIMHANQIAIRTHDPMLRVCDDRDTALILVDRRDRFAAVMSNLIANHTGQTTHYDCARPAPFEGDPTDFEHLYRMHKQYYNRHDFSRLYHRIDKFYFEDFVTDHDFVYRRLGLAKSSAPREAAHVQRLINSPAPYSYHDVVMNHTDLRALFDQLCTQNDT